MFKKRWLNWVMAIVILVTTNVASWNRGEIAKLFASEKPVGDVNIGVLISNKKLSGNKVEDIAFAKKYLSEDYHWIYIPDEYEGKIPLPWPPFSESTGFHLQPTFKREGQQLLAQK